MAEENQRVSTSLPGGPRFGYTTHMRRRIPDEIRQQIQRAREREGLTLPALVTRFGHSKSTIYGIIKDCDSSRVQRAAPTRPVVPQVVPQKRPPLSKVDLGEAARQIIAARLMWAGVKVFRPMTEDTPIDLLVLAGNKAVKCQCKYIYPEPRGNHAMNLTATRKNNPAKKTHTHRYTTDEVDFFLGYCLDNDTVYVIPNADTGGRKTLTFWVLREPRGRNHHVPLDTAPYAAAYQLLSP